MKLKKDYKKIFVLDTNIILDDCNIIKQLSQNNENLIVVPHIVLNELDNKKYGFEEINFQAREFSRILSNSKVLKNYMENGVNFIDYLTEDDIEISICTFEDFEKDISNDLKIIKTAYKLNKNYENITVLTNDMLCKVISLTHNLKTENITNNNKDLKFEFIKELNLGETQFIENNQDILTIDNNYQKENYCYVFNYPNGKKILAYILNDKIQIINENELRKNIIKPLNLGQIFASAGMSDTRIDVCLINALAGSGKTLLALAWAINAIKKKQYSKIIYIRNSVESVDKAEEVGFLPGLEEKFKIYNYPLYDSLEHIVKNSIKKYESYEESIDNKIQEYLAKYNIQTMWPGSIRGRTISDAYVIIDEIQNFSKTSLLTVLSRLDDKCKVVCIGSNRQIDHPYINKYNNGLSYLLKRTKVNNDINLFATNLDKVVRGKITKWSEEIFNKVGDERI